MLPAAQWGAQIDPVVNDSALRQRPLYFHPLVLFYGGVGRVVVVEGWSGLVDHVVILDDVVLHLGRQLVELSDGDAHVQTSEDVAQIFITVHSVVLGVHRPAQYSGGLSLLLLLLHFQLGFGMAVVLLSHVFRIAELVQVVGSRSWLGWGFLWILDDESIGGDDSDGHADGSVVSAEIVDALPAGDVDGVSVDNSVSPSSLQNALMFIGKYFWQLGLADRYNFEEIVVAVYLVPLNEVAQIDIFIFTKYIEKLFLFQYLLLLNYFWCAFGVFVLLQFF